MKIFKLPDLGEGLPDAEINEWYIKEGDTVKLDQPMASMETAKAVVDVPAPRAGTIAKLYGQAGDIIKTGAPLVEFTDGEDDKAKPAKAKDAGTVVGNIKVDDKVITESATGITQQKNTGAIKIIPAVRMLAKKLGVDLSAVTPTGKNGLITVNDVKQAAGNTSANPASSSTTPTIEGATPLRGVRRMMAIAMSESHKQVVPVTISDEADINHWPQGTDITIRLIRALIAGCKTEPSLNAYYDGPANAIKPIAEINLGLAMDSDEGLFVPVIKDVAELTDADIRQTIQRYKQEVKSREIPQDDLQGATITLSNFGVFAGRYANPIVTPPQVAILGVGKLREAVVADKSKPAVHKVIPLSVTFDHRAATGGEAVRFLAAIIESLQQ